MIYLYAACYVLYVLLADILAARFIVPLPLGLAVPAGVFAIAPVFTLRDRIHDTWGRRGAYVLIGAASLMSWGIAALTGDGLLALVTLASITAFVVSEAVDTEVYHRARCRNLSRFWAIQLSNLFSTPADSVIFIGLAFGLVWPLIVGQIVVKLLLAGLLGAALEATRRCNGR